MLHIEKLLDTEYMTSLFWEHRTKIDTRIQKIISLNAKKIKFYNEHDFQHAVVQYELWFYDEVEWQQYVKMYASAHSDGSRKRSFQFMKHIHENGFGLDEYYSSTKPLFYLDEFKASFHEELMGENLLFITQQHPELLAEGASEAAKCLARFHSLPFPKKLKLETYPFNREHIDPSCIMKRVEDSFEDEKKLIHDTFEILEKFKNKNNDLFSEYVFSHGDFHLENILIGTDFANNPVPFTKVGIIDYTDVCLADRGLDVGSFTQKLHFIATYKLGYTKERAHDFVQSCITTYCDAANITHTPEFQKGVLFWQTWNALRVLTNYMLFPKKETARNILVAFIQNNTKQLTA